MEKRLLKLMPVWQHSVNLAPTAALYSVFGDVPRIPPFRLTLEILIYAFLSGGQPLRENRIGAHFALDQPSALIGMFEPPPPSALIVIL